ncbi:hypothetical protein BH10ACT9_BH10ACT9_60910 [soil metagenome]
MPWWGAVVIAVTASIIGFAFDAGSGNKELTSAFAALYFIGCVAAVLAVRQNGVFTAVVQPPLILFIAVPGAYFLFHQSEINGVKDILINCGYPLIERFLLMFTTSVVVLLIGAARWYLGKSAPAADEADDEASAPPASGIRAKLSSLFAGGSADDEDDAEPPQKHGIDRPATAQRRSSRRPTSGSPKRPPPTRSRHARPPTDDLDEVPPPRRRRPATPGDEAEPRRRPRPTREPREPGARNPSREYRPRERDRESWEREPYERPRRRPNPYESYEPSETFDASPPRPRRPASGGGSGSTHHPVSRVRYRGSDEGDDRVEHRTRPRSRARHSLDSDRWPD